MLQALSAQIAQSKSLLVTFEEKLEQSLGEETAQQTAQADTSGGIDEKNAEDAAEKEDEKDVEDEKEAELPEDPNATSYYDESESKDEVDEENPEQEVAKQEPQEVLPKEAEAALDSLLDVADQALRIQDQFSYTVGRGDKLKDVLEQSGLSASVAKSMIKRDPELNNLQGGQQFYWILDNQGQLEYMNWLVSEKEERVYERKENGKWAIQRIEKKGEWRQDVVRGIINGGFDQSLKLVGLSDRQISQLSVGLQSQIATNKLKKGDKFAILVKREYINGTVTDVGNVEGIVVVSDKKSFYAIQADNGRYYSNHGETLNKGFARQPLLFTSRISSHFNPRRLHPITKRVRPHNGTDFPLAVGTPIVAPSDGVVDHVAYQPNGAGHYIRIRHGYISTVYMHLSKKLVKVGQTVKKGDRIALSGNSGASTGPHLHYELHINGRPVNAMTVKLPGSNTGMADKERQSFLARAKNVMAKLKF
ncbi:murein DD-endopeptidase MepM [Haemophilus paracuniculus]|uniref:Murein DD-endopeptidase MepM n=1 Tax=Haemophilus paracuniculus TaxID=734 RepID=A0A1T0ARF6_9PAST|nr:murein DD-endopeptidase MepM [Haemophilus paracuniculus]